MPAAVLRALSLVLLLSFSFAVAAAEGSALPKGVSAGASVEGITEYRLANGLTVLLFPDASKPTTTVNITYKVGSLHENYGETGMAHLLEHLLFKGTPSLADIPGEMKKRGMSYNASTWLDRTNYYETFPANDDQLAFALRLEADRMVNSFVARKDLDSEMTVVRNEMEAGENNPVGIVLQRVMSAAYDWHNYGNSTIGARADVENVSIERLQAFYRSYYQPDNAVLLVAGRFDPAATLALINASFGKIPAPARKLTPLYTAEAVQDGERSVTVRRVGDVPFIGVAYHIPAASHADAAAIALLSQVLGDTPRGRLHKALVEPGQATFAGAFSFSLREPGSTLFFAQATKDGDIDALGQRLIAEVENGARKPVTDDEVERSRATLLKGYEQSLNDANRVGLLLSESIAAGDWRLFFLNRDRIQAATAADVNRVAEAYLKTSNRTLGRFIPTATPDRAIMPATPDVAALVKDYRGQAAVVAGEAFDVSPANIESRTVRGSLANGGKYALLFKRTRGNTVRVSITLNFGDATSLQGRKHAAEAAGNLLMHGTDTLSREQIATRFDQLKATVGIGSGGSAEDVVATVQTTREHLPAVLELVAELLKKSSFPESEFQQYRNQAITGLEEQRNDPSAIASNALNRHFNALPKGHPKTAESFEEMLASLRALTLAEVKAFHAGFYGADHAQIAVVGDFDAGQVTTQLDSLFGSWKSPASYSRIADPFRAVAVVDQTFPTPDKANGMLFMGISIPVSQQHADYAGLVVANYILGGGSLKSRLADRVRQKEGLSYGAGSQFTGDYFDEKAGLFAYAIAAPENLAKVQTAFREEFVRLVSAGVTEEEVRSSVDGMLKSRATGRADDGALAGRLAADLFFGRTMVDYAEYEAELAALTAEQVNAALRRHFKPEQLSFFRAGDFEAAAKRAAKP